MVEHLQRATERIRALDVGIFFAMDIHHHPSDGSGGAHAVVHQIVPVAVAQLGRVLDEGGQEIAAIRRAVALFQQALVVGHRPVRQGRFVDREGALHGFQPRHLLLGRNVRRIGDIVRLSCEDVEGMDMRAKLARDKKGADGKILGIFVDQLARAAAGLDTARRLPCHIAASQFSRHLCIG